MNWKSRCRRVVVLIAVVGVAVACNVGAARQQARLVPAPIVEEPASTRSSEVAVLAGGCFWGVQGVYQHMNGVTSAVSGYAGGEKRTATYVQVGGGRTGHAESVEITFDPRIVSYGKILQVFFSVVHDPTQLNRQGPDVGTEYRSTVFPTSARQAEIAKTYIAQLTQARVFVRPIVTTIEPDRPFYRAEDYHQDYMVLNPRDAYIVVNDLPKVHDLKRLFPDLYRTTPVLVRTAK